jgi:hypothetical protein
MTAGREFSRLVKEKETKNCRNVLLRQNDGARRALFLFPLSRISLFFLDFFFAGISD